MRQRAVKEAKAASAPLPHGGRLRLLLTLWPPKLVVAVGYAVAFLALAAAVWLVTRVIVGLALVFVPLLVALLLTTILQPPARWLMYRGASPSLAASLVFAAGAALLLAVGFFVVPQVVEQLESLDEVARRARALLAGAPFHLSGGQIDQWIDRLQRSITEGPPSLVARLFERMVTAMEVGAAFVLMLVLTFFFTRDGERMTEWAKAQLREPARSHAAAAFGRAWNSVGSYVRGSALVGVAEAVMFAIALLAIGVPLVAPISVVAFFGGFLPLVGVVATGVLAGLVALVSGGAVDAILVLVALIVVQQIEGNILEPVILGRAVALHPVVILLVVATGLLLWGIFGALLAVPFTAVVADLVKYVREVSGGAECEPREGSD